MASQEDKMADAKPALFRPHTPSPPPTAEEEAATAVILRRGRSSQMTAFVSAVRGHSHITSASGGIYPPKNIPKYGRLHEFFPSFSLKIQSFFADVICRMVPSCWFFPYPLWLMGKISEDGKILSCRPHLLLRRRPSDCRPTWSGATDLK